MRIGVIGPTDLEKLGRLLNQPLEFLLERAALVGKLIAGSGAEMWVNGDGGMLTAVARAYKENAGNRLVILYPIRPDPWPIAHTEPYVGLADTVVRTSTWFDANYIVVSETDICVCVGLSTGTLSEIAYINWDDMFQTSALKRLVMLQELMRLKRLFPEIGLNPDKVRYIAHVEDLVKVLEEVDCNDKEPVPV